VTQDFNAYLSRSVVWILILFPSRIHEKNKKNIPDPGVKIALDPGSGSATQVAWQLDLRIGEKMALTPYYFLEAVFYFSTHD
jgi:hypothetical protein